MSVVFDNRVCDLGEGPLWHPLRKQLFWFDILSGRLLSQKDSQPSEWEFDECVSASGWIDADTLLMASETGLWRFDIDSGEHELVVTLERGNPVTRSNDGRADPWGGFWIGTMGKKAEKGAGAIYRFHRGSLRTITADLTIPNAICFAPDENIAYFTDTVTGQVMRQMLDPKDGWPVSNPSLFLDLTDEGLNPDGAVVDADGLVWIAQWGAARVAAYYPDGGFVRAIEVPGLHATCPAFGGEALDTIFCTSARQGLTDEAITDEPRNGMTFACAAGAKGQPEHQVIL